MAAIENAARRDSGHMGTDLADKERVLVGFSYVYEGQEWLCPVSDSS